MSFQVGKNVYLFKLEFIVFSEEFLTLRYVGFFNFCLEYVFAWNSKL